MKISLRAARVDVGLRQQDMADMLDVNKKTIQSWEAGKTVPKSDMVPAICEVLGRAYDEIRWKS